VIIDAHEDQVVQFHGFPQVATDVTVRIVALTVAANPPPWGPHLEHGPPIISGPFEALNPPSR